MYFVYIYRWYMKFETYLSKTMIILGLENVKNSVCPFVDMSTHIYTVKEKRGFAILLIPITHPMYFLVSFTFYGERIGC